MGYLFLILFAATLFVLYIAVRRGWGETLPLGGSGAILSTLFIVLYSLVQEKTSAGQAIFAGLVVGLGFSVTVVIIASFFRTNQPSAEVKLVTRSPQEESNHERRDHFTPPPE